MGGIYLNNGILAICDSNAKYINRLSELLGLRETFPFRIVTYTDGFQIVEKKSFLNLEVLLISEKEYQKIYEIKQWQRDLDKMIVIILEEGGVNKAQDKPTIYKYQSGENIRKELLRIYGQQKGDGVQSKIGHKKTKIIGVYSPIGRCGQTSFCLLLGQILAKEKKVLYLNFEPYSGFSTLINQKDEKDISDLIYSMRGDEEKLSYQLESMLLNLNGLDYIAPTSVFSDIQSITEENWIILISALKKLRQYDYVILDLSEMVQGLLEVLRECNLVYTITQKDGFAMAKIYQYENLLSIYEYEDVKDKTRKCEFPVFRKLPTGIDQLPYSEMAGVVKRMIQEEVEFLE